MQRAKDYVHQQGARSLEELGDLMRQTARHWEQTLAPMTEEQLLFHPTITGGGLVTPASGEGPKWCAKEVVGHYLVSERGLNGQVAGLGGVQPPREAPAVRAMGMLWPEDEELAAATLLSLLTEFFAETQTLLGRLAGSDNLGESFPHPVFGPLNLKEWIAFHRIHAFDHIQQIERLKADPAYPTA